ncbi:MAG: hypothetical protein KDD61_02260 [Bdellovibrionales bacterium]|nr:hypothetical protein [Bdellovibrionales bacterium]
MKRVSTLIVIILVSLPILLIGNSTFSIRWNDAKGSSSEDLELSEGMAVAGGPTIPCTGI